MSAAVWEAANASTSAAVEITAPIPWANRFGGPGTGFFGPSRGATTSIANRPSGLSVGPVSTRAQNPYAIGISSQYQPVASVRITPASTKPATTRAAFSFTGLGNANSSRMPPMILNRIGGLGSGARSLQRNARPEL